MQVSLCFVTLCLYKDLVILETFGTSFELGYIMFIDVDV